MNALVIIAALILTAPGQSTTATTGSGNADVLGRWDVTFNTHDGPVASQMVFKKAGEKIVGTITSHLGESTTEADVKGTALTVWFTYQSPDGPLAITMNGAIAGETTKGTFSVGSDVGGDWSGTRAKDAKDPSPPSKAPSTPSLTGTWNVALELPNISATPTLTLKQDGEALTGDYISAQYGTFPVTGTVKGSDLTFRFAMTVEGNTYDVTYSGTVDKDTMKGSVNIGEAMSGTFTAARKK